MQQFPSTLFDMVLFRLLLFSVLFTSASSNKQCNWHTRQGHPSEMILNKLAMRTDLNCKIDSASSKYLLCPLAKAYKLPLVASTSKLVKPFDLVYVDLWTSHIVSITTAKYCLLLVDDYSKYMWLYFLSTKNQTQIAMDLFKAMIERQFKCNIKAVQSDDGVNFIFLAIGNKTLELNMGLPAHIHLIKMAQLKVGLGGWLKEVSQVVLIFCSTY